MSQFYVHETFGGLIRGLIHYLLTRDIECSYTVLPSVLWIAFSALTLLIGRQEEHPARKKWVMRCWRGYLSGTRCKWFAYDPTDATATPWSLASLKSRLVWPTWCWLTQFVLQEVVKWMYTTTYAVYRDVVNQCERCGWCGPTISHHSSWQQVCCGGDSTRHHWWPSAHISQLITIIIFMGGDALRLGR